LVPGIAPAGVLLIFSMEMKIRKDIFNLIDGLNSGIIQFWAGLYMKCVNGCHGRLNKGDNMSKKPDNILQNFRLTQCVKGAG